MKNYQDLSAFAQGCGFFVTSTTGGQHNAGSKHALGLAIDVRTRDKEKAEIDAFISKCAMIGVKVWDERIKPNGQKVWSGAHLHLEIMPTTEKVIRNFQMRDNLTVDEICGAKTIAALIPQLQCFIDIQQSNCRLTCEKFLKSVRDTILLSPTPFHVCR